MSKTLRLRAWQRDALDLLITEQPRTSLFVATPGAGKTTFGLTALLHLLRDYPHAPVAVVAPTAHLKRQWAAAAAGFGLRLTPTVNTRAGLPRDVHGGVLTYAQVASDPEGVARMFGGALVLADEVHHAGAELTWGDGLSSAFEDALRVVALSGTPFRSDSNPIPFVRYDEAGFAQATYTYGYGEALTDGSVVRPVFFPRIGGTMEWHSSSGKQYTASFDDELTSDLQAQRLRTALDPSGQWLPTVIEQGHEQLMRLRRTQPDAGGIAFAMNIDHAHAIASELARVTGKLPPVATSDDPQASKTVESFANSDAPWVVTSRLISEGVDIPRLRVGVYATNIRRDLFFYQAVGRICRWQPGMRRQRAYMFIPDDPVLRHLAGSMTEQRTHALKQREESDVEKAVSDPEAPFEQSSLFAALSSTPGEVAGTMDLLALDEEDLDPAGDAIDVDDPRLLVALPPPPRRAGDDDLAPFQHELLRKDNHARVSLIARMTGMGPEAVNSRLNRDAGIRSVVDATTAQLTARLGLADRWLESI